MSWHVVGKAAGMMGDPITFLKNQLIVLNQPVAYSKKRVRIQS